VAVVVFISHAGTDQWIAEQIGRYVGETGAGYFLDVVDVEAGDDFDDRIRDGLARCTELVVLLTPSSRDRRWVWMEIGGAWAQGKRVVAVVYGMTVEEVVNDPDIPIPIRRKDMTHLNDVGDYIRELRRRVEAEA
jgi:hypothetical protein